MADLQGGTLAILVVEDAEFDYEMLLATLQRTGAAIESVRVETEADMRAQLAARTWDAVISDHNLPQFSSTGALETLKSTGLDLPFIIVSGDIGEDVAVEAMRDGADDYLLKGRLKRLPTALSNAIEAARNRALRRQAEAALARSEQRLRHLAQHMDTAKEREHAQIARQLHDRVGTDLAAAKFLIAHMRRAAETGALDSPNKVAAQLIEVEDLLVAATSACSEISQTLRPDLLDAGPVAAIEWLVTAFGKAYHIDARFDSNREEIPLAAESKIAAYRFVEEALDNIAKHARATKVECVMFADTENITIEVSDNGKGFDDAALERTGKFGLMEIRERLAALEGELDISRRAPSAKPGDRNAGATVMITLPIHSKATP